MKPSLLVTVALILCAGCADAFGFGDVEDSEAGRCQVAITNSLATIYEEPDRFSQEIVDIPRGTYEVFDFVVIDEGRSQRWLFIDVDGRNGWVADTTFAIEKKSPACP